MPKQAPGSKFCGVGDFSVLIPYRDLENLLQTAKNLGAIQDRMEKLEKQHDSLRSMYFEALDKIGEINRLL